MFRRQGENLRSVNILLFLNIAFFLLQIEDAQKYYGLFAFERHAVAAGQVWRLLTYQFIQASRFGPFNIHPIFSLIISMTLLTLLGNAVEEEWGTFHFMTFFAISTLGSAAVAAMLGVPVLGSFFISYSLLFVYASLYPGETFYLYIIPIRAAWLAIFSAAMLLFGVFMGSGAAIAALGGAVLSYGYYLWQRTRPEAVSPRMKRPKIEERDEQANVVAVTRNITRFAAIKNALTTGSSSDIDRLIGLSEREVVSGVNICPPIDYKPEASDGYCIRCEGFAECSARYLRLNRPKPMPPTDEATSPA